MIVVAHRRDEAAPERARAPHPTTGVAPAGNRPTGVIRLQRTAGNAAVSSLLRAGALDLAVQRDKKKKAPAKKPPSTDPPQKQLADIQGHAMDALLPELAALEPEVRSDEALGLAVGGTRLVMAMQTVAAKTGKTAWTAFLASKKTDFMTWPPDQIGSILRFLGAPTETAAMQELVVGALPEIVNNDQKDLPLVEKGRSDLIRTTVGEMTKIGLGYGSTTPFVQDVKQRVLVALYMRSSQMGGKDVAKGFSYPNRESDGTPGVAAKVNDAAKAYWTANEGGEAYYFRLSEAGRKDGHTAITSLFTPQTDPKARTLIHCDYLVSLIEYRAWAETIGVEKFNANVNALKIVPVLKYDGFADLAKPTSELLDKSVLQPLEKVTLTSESELVVGDHVVFYNHPTYDALTAKDPDVWKLENAIIVDGGGGGLLFQGHGYPTPLPKSALMDALCAKYNLHVDRALAFIKAEKAAKGQAAKDAAKAARLAKYPNVVKNSAGKWEVIGKSSVTNNVERRGLGYLTPATAPGLRHPLDNALIARRPSHG